MICRRRKIIGTKRGRKIITTFFRSSSYNAFDFCATRYYLEYVLGIKSPSSKKATKGSITHKALELLAQRKLAEQNGVASVHDEETGLTKLRHNITPKVAIATAWDHYTRTESHHEWTDRDLRDCRKWMQNALDYRDGMLNPLKLHVIEPEKYFSFEIDEPWAAYDYTLPNGDRLRGQLGLKGTMDLLIRDKSGPLLNVDWKTGQPKDWASGKEKDFDSLSNDPQLRLYHYALSRLYPQEREIFITIFYLQFEKPYSLCFTRDDLKKTELMIRKRFEQIKSMTNPPWIRNDPKHRWKCERLCHFNKKENSSQKSICEQVKSDLLQIGMERTNQKYMDVTKVSAYGSGGGSSNRE